MSKFLFPAHAGVIPGVQITGLPSAAFPRTRGGDPGELVIFEMRCAFSPHTRG